MVDCVLWSSEGHFLFELKLEKESALKIISCPFIVVTPFERCICSNSLPELSADDSQGVALTITALMELSRREFILGGAIEKLNLRKATQFLQQVLVFLAIVLVIRVYFRLDQFSFVDPNYLFFFISLFTFREILDQIPSKLFQLLYRLFSLRFIGLKIRVSFYLNIAFAQKILDQFLHVFAPQTLRILFEINFVNNLGGFSEFPFFALFNHFSSVGYESINDIIFDCKEMPQKFVLNKKSVLN